MLCEWKSGLGSYSTEMVQGFPWAFWTSRTATFKLKKQEDRDVQKTAAMFKNSPGTLQKRYLNFINDRLFVNTMCRELDHKLIYETLSLQNYEPCSTTYIRGSTSVLIPTVIHASLEMQTES